MKIDKVVKDSQAYSLFKALFITKEEVAFSSTRFGTFFSKLPSSNTLAEILVFSAVALLIYERLADRYLPLLGNDFLPPFLLLAAFLLLDKKKFYLKKHHLWYLGFLSTSLVAGIFGVWRFGAGGEVLLGFSILAQFILAFMLGELLTRRLFWPVAVLSTPLMLGGFWQIMVGEGFRYSYLEASGLRVTSFVENPNIFGFILVTFFLFFTSTLLAQKLTVKKNLPTVFLMLFILILVFLTGSRSAWLALILGTSVQLFFLRPKLLLFSPLALGFLLVTRIRERLALVFSDSYLLDSSIDGRLWSLKNSLYIWSKNILGTGPGTYGDRFARETASGVYLEGLQRGYPALLTTDNQYLAILVQTGLLGFLAFLAFWVALFANYLKKKEALGTSLAISFLIMMLFSNTFNFGVVAVPVAILLGQSAAK